MVTGGGCGQPIRSLEGGDGGRGLELRLENQVLLGDRAAAGERGRREGWAAILSGAGERGGREGWGAVLTDPLLIW